MQLQLLSSLDSAGVPKVGCVNLSGNTLPSDIALWEIEKLEYLGDSIQLWTTRLKICGIIEKNNTQNISFTSSIGLYP